MKKTLPLKLTDKELKVLVDYVLTDIEFGAEGTFHKFKDGEYEFDKREAKKALNVLSKIIGFDFDEVKYLG